MPNQRICEHILPDGRRCTQWATQYSSISMGGPGLCRLHGGLAPKEETQEDPLDLDRTMGIVNSLIADVESHIAKERFKAQTEGIDFIPNDRILQAVAKLAKIKNDMVREQRQVVKNQSEHLVELDEVLKVINIYKGTLAKHIGVELLNEVITEYRATLPKHYIERLDAIDRERKARRLGQG